MTIKLKPEQQNCIAEALRPGAYQGPDDLIDEGILEAELDVRLEGLQAQPE